MDLLKSLVIFPNERASDVGSLLAIARAVAKRQEHTRRPVEVKVIKFVPELGVYVAVYEGCSKRLT